MDAKSDGGKPKVRVKKAPLARVIPVVSEVPGLKTPVKSQKKDELESRRKT